MHSSNFLRLAKAERTVGSSEDILPRDFFSEQQKTIVRGTASSLRWSLSGLKSEPRNLRIARFSLK